jgi:cytochrome oxidase assembly protein ShyY1
LDDGPHLAYAIQWFAFAILALVFAGIMSRRT